MNKSYLVIVVLAIGSLFATRSQAQEFTPCRPGATVIYMNGVFNFNEQDALNSARKLGSEISHFGTSCVSKVAYLYNPSVSLGLGDLIEAANQIAAERAISFSDTFLQVGLSVFGAASIFSQSEQDRIRARVASLIQRITLSTTIAVPGTLITTADLVRDFRDRVLTELGQGTKTILVAHSQGNFFANSVFLEVHALGPDPVSQGLAVVNVANPTASAPSGLCITGDHDVIIGLLAPGAMNCNVNSAGSYEIADNSLGHSFPSIYLNRRIPTGTTEIMSMAGQLMEKLRQAISATATPVGEIYGSTSRYFFGFDIAARSTVILGAFTYSTGSVVPVWDIAVNPRGGLIYAISPSAVSAFVGSDRVLLRLPQSTVGGNALAFNADGELFSMDQSSIYRIDTASGAATLLPMSLGTLTSSGDLAFDSDGVLYGTAMGPSGGDYLVRIDVNRSTLHVIGPIGYREVYGLYFSAGYLFGVTNSGALITIDRNSGAGQFVGNLSIGDITGLQ